MSKSYKIGDRLEVTVQKIVPRGFGLAFAEGLTVFVPLSAVGDKLDVQIVEIKGKTAFAEIVSVIEPSPERIEQPCIYFGTCGGCDLQQMNYAAQLAAKVGMIKDSLERIGKIERIPEIAVVASPLEFGYRTRAQWHMDSRQKTLGYFKRNSHEIVDIKECPILDPALNETLRELRSELSWDSFWSEKIEIEAACGSDGSVSLNSPELPEEAREIAFTNGADTYLYSAETFFQGNRSLIPKLLDAALDGAAGERAFDLYCGVGLFTLPLARRFGKVTGVEESQKAIEFAKRNTAASGIGNVRFIAKGVAEFLSGRKRGDADLILLDPPRAGTERGVIDKIIEIRPRAISYVACDPPMLARDLRRLIGGGYRIISVSAVDLFPQNHHVETVVRLNLG